MIHKISINDLLYSTEPVPIADVRTPAEFAHGHIPGAFNLPLFTNEERVQVGTTYKQVGREAAILLGFDLTGAKWSGFVRRALEIAPDKKIAVHCWRGGMRSGAMAWALDLYGFEVYVLKGGYKSYRRWVLQQFEATYQLCIVGGMTGSGKTDTLHQIGASGEQVIDLEDLAQHRGSSYGTMNKLIQPTQEQFENNFADKLRQLKKERRIWVEDESISIGKRFVPKSFWNQMQASVLIDIHVPLSQRLQRLVAEYGLLDKQFLAECTERIKKRLGPEQTKHALAALWENRMEEFFRLVVVYYDKTYRNGLNKRSPNLIYSIKMETTDPSYQAKQILNFVQMLPALTLQ